MKVRVYDINFNLPDLLDREEIGAEERYDEVCDMIWEDLARTKEGWPKAHGLLHVLYDYTVDKYHQEPMVQC